MKNTNFLRIGETWMNRFNINSIACSSLIEEKGPHTIKVSFRDGQIEDFKLDSLKQLKNTIGVMTNEYSLVDTKVKNTDIDMPF